MNEDKFLLQAWDLLRSVTTFLAVENCDREDKKIARKQLNECLKIFTTDELMKELMKRKAIFVAPKINLDDGAVG